MTTEDIVRHSVNSKPSSMAHQNTCLLFLSLIMTALSNAEQPASYKEKHRLQIHYSPPHGWLSDTNGLVFENGTYHLFFQHYPDGTLWNTMHWGHATSTDLIHWTTLPIAIYPYEKGAIFSGSVIVDRDNVAGLADSSSADPPFIAIYTLAGKDVPTSQALAYSRDHGLSFSQYASNPVIPNPGIADFRDPNIIRRNGIYYLTLAAGDKVMFYSSSDLKSWSFLSDFSAGEHSLGGWECPSIFSLNMEGGSSEEKYDVLVLSMNSDEHGCLAQYFTGSFDGTTFRHKDESTTLWFDNGPDNYAAIPYHTDPQGRIIMIGWMSNWLYCQDIPTSTWRGQMTIPRQLALQRVAGQLHLIQKPVQEFDSLLDHSRSFILEVPITLRRNESFDASSRLRFKTNSLMNLEYMIDLKMARTGKISIKFSNALGEKITFDYNIENKMYEFDRRHSGDVSFNPNFANKKGISTFPRIATSSILTGRIILDTSSIEIFADGGLNTVTSLFFPNALLENVHIHADLAADESVSLTGLRITALRGVWDA